MLTAVLSLLVGGLCAATLLGFLARWSWWGELACHFRLQYALGLLLAGSALALAGAPALAWIAAGVGALNVVLILPLYVRAPRRAAPPVLRTLVANIWLKNRAYARMQELIQRVQPDVFVLIETNSEWIVALRELAAAYPYSKAVAYLPGFGMMLCSRWPMLEARVLHFGGHGPPSIAATLDWHGRSIMVLGTHPMAPVRRSTHRHRDRQCLELAAFVRTQEMPVVVVGDFNATSWSPIFGRMLKAAGLRDSRQGFGPQPTWPAPASWLGIPIDHCLLSPHWQVLRRRAGPDVGSDHLPVMVDCALNA